MKFGIGKAIGVALAAGSMIAPAPMTAAEADGHVPRPPRFKPVPRKQPRKANLVERVMSPIVGGLAGDAFVTHVVTPKPMSKRRRRRLRGKAKGIARELRTDMRNRPQLYRDAAVLQAQLKAHDNDWQF